jgi:hypothetical protein
MFENASNKQQELPLPIIQTRMSQCLNCEERCDFTDPCASCKKGRWGPVFCDKNELSPVELVGRLFKLNEEDKGNEPNRNLKPTKEEVEKLLEGVRAKYNLTEVAENKNGSSFPSVGAMTLSLMGALKQELSDRLNKKDKLSEEEIESRRAICNGCEHFANGRCKKCGCFLKFKTAMRSQHCPIGKW